MKRLIYEVSESWKIAFGQMQSNKTRSMLTALGVIIGVAAAFALTRLLGNLLYGVPAFDSLTFGAVVLLLAVIAFLACWLPAQRATAVSPLVALRME